MNVIPFLMGEQANLLTFPLWIDSAMAERQVIKEKYRKRGLFDFPHFLALLLLGDRVAAAGLS